MGVYNSYLCYTDYGCVTNDPQIQRLQIIKIYYLIVSVGEESSTA